MLGEELGRVRVPAGQPFLEQAVEVPDHLPVGGQFLRGRALDGVGQAADVLVEDLLPETLDEGVEALPGAGLHEVVLLEAADPAADVGRQGVELVEPLGRHVAEHLPQGRVVRRRCVRCLGVRRGRRRLLRLLRRRSGGSGVEAALHACPFLADDLVELPAHVAEDVAELVAFEQLLAAPGETVEEIAQAGHVRSGRVGRAPAALHEPAERRLDIALGHHVVGERVEDLVRVEVGQRLAAVPRGVAGCPGQGDPARVEGRGAVPEVPAIRRESVGGGSEAGHRR